MSSLHLVWAILITNAIHGIDVPYIRDSLSEYGIGKEDVKRMMTELILNDNWAAYSGNVETLGLVSGDDPALNYVQIPSSTQWADTFTEADYVALVGELFDGTRVVSNDTENEPEVAITVNYLGNIK